jgi:hypothetical protein
MASLFVGQELVFALLKRWPSEIIIAYTYMFTLPINSLGQLAKLCALLLRLHAKTS